MIFKDGELFVEGSHERFLESKWKIEYKLAKLIEEAKSKKLVNETKISSIIRAFVSDVSSILRKIESGKDTIALEEAIKLHKIEEYIIFLTGIGDLEFVSILRNLKGRSSRWVEQDKGTLEKLWIDSNLIKQIVSSNKRNFAGMGVSKTNVDGIPISIYCKDFNKPPPKAVLMLHGFAGDRKAMDLLCKRVANQGYLACSFELPGHYLEAKTEDEFKLGVACEYISRAVKFLRGQLGIKRVAVIGHSAGAVDALFSLAYYNSNIEGNIYAIFERYLKHFEQLSQSRGDNEQIRNVLESLYGQIKSLIFNALEQTRFDYGRIDAVIAIAPPQRFQIDFTPRMAKAALSLKWFLKRGHNHMITGESAYGAGSFRTYELEEFIRYILNIKNPCDYMNLIDFFANLAIEGRMNLAKYYRDRYIEAVPKLILYGKQMDFINRLFLPAHFKKYESVYSQLGNTTIKPFFQSHWMSEGIDTLKGRVATSPKIVLEIMDFLEKNL